MPTLDVLPPPSPGELPPSGLLALLQTTFPQMGWSQGEAASEYRGVVSPDRDPSPVILLQVLPGTGGDFRVFGELSPTPGTVSHSVSRSGSSPAVVATAAVRYLLASVR